MTKAVNMTLNDFKFSKYEIEQYFLSLIEGKEHLSNLARIFRIAIETPEIFPNIKLEESGTYKDYILRWIRAYEEAMSNLPSKRIAKPKSSCSDPAIKTIVKIVKNIDDDEAEIQNSYHNLFMSAENILGNLLEEYIYNSTEKYGWIWCAGNILRAVDFCMPEGPVYLQIKNKSNTENSSSSAIRTGTNIMKWYRLGTKSRSGIKFPDYKWELLNEIININGNGLLPACNMTEKGYQMFLHDVAVENPQIITDK